MTAHEQRPSGSGYGINPGPVQKLPAGGDRRNPTRTAEGQTVRVPAAAPPPSAVVAGVAVIANRPAVEGIEPNGKWGFERLRPPPLCTAGPVSRSRFPPHSLLPARENAVGGGGGGGGGGGAERAAPLPPCRLAPPFLARHPHAKTWGRAA